MKKKNTKMSFITCLQEFIQSLLILKSRSVNAFTLVDCDIA